MLELGLRDSGLGESITTEGELDASLKEVVSKCLAEGERHSQTIIPKHEQQQQESHHGAESTAKEPDHSKLASQHDSHISPASTVEKPNDPDDAVTGSGGQPKDEDATEGAAPEKEDDAPSEKTAPDDGSRKALKNFHLDVTCPKCNTEICSSAPEPEKDSESEAAKKPGDSKDESNEPEPEEPPTDGPYILYKAVYVDPDDDDDILFDTKSYKPTPLGAAESGQLSHPVFDVVKRYTAAAHVPRWDRYDGPLKKPPRTDSKPKYSLVIRSQAIIRALQTTVQFYPGVDLFKDSIKIDEPFQMLIHHYDDIVAFRDARSPENLCEGACETARDAHAHMTMLIDFLEQLIMPEVRAERARHERGVATWNMLWLLLRPGTDVARLTFSGASTTKRSATYNRDGAIVQSIERENMTDASYWEVKTWHLRYNGDVIGREEHRELIHYFDGEMELSRISILPIHYAPMAPNNTNAKEYLTNKGMQYFDLLRPQCKHHRGETLEYPFQQIEAQVQVDFPTFFDSLPEFRPDLSDPPKGPQTTPGPDCDCSSCKTGPVVENLLRKYSSYHGIIPEVGSSLTPHQYFLCGQAVWAYMFKIRDWQLLDVANLSDAEFRPEMINTLVIDPKRLRMLKALSQSFMRESINTGATLSQPWTADFVKGKGNSQIFLLHGPPGVGKTYTAECMAEHTRRPLMTLTSSDIGTTPAEVEKSLSDSFKLAKKWQAILLIDEADIYLERRSLTDLTRNSLVASFLRALEFYEGILFLTTNRVGSFDDAFVSRIHVKLHYPALSEEDREQIWDNFINKLKVERGHAVRVMRDVKTYITSNKIRELKLNGREIRNVFQTAVGLAEFEGEKDEEGKIKISEDHLAQVAEMTGEFKNYLDDLHLADEEKRAQKLFLRKDETLTPAATPSKR